MIILRKAGTYEKAKHQVPYVPKTTTNDKPFTWNTREVKNFCSQAYKTQRDLFISKSPEDKQSQDKEVRAWSAAFCSAPC